MPKVKIKKPANRTDLDRGSNYFNTISPYEYSESTSGVNRTLKPVDKDKSNLEAEKNERVITDLNGDGIPENYRVGGKRHSQGGTPLALPEASFIFSDTKALKIKDAEILKEFDIAESKAKKGITPSDIAKKYDLNKYKEILLNEDSTPMQRDTAELMISNYNNKLGKLALVQESMKGFDNGIPDIALPYLMGTGINPESILPQQQTNMNPPIMKYGGQLRKFQVGGQTGSDDEWTNNYNRYLRDEYAQHIQEFSLDPNELDFDTWKNSLNNYDVEVKEAATKFANETSPRNGVQTFRKTADVNNGAIYSRQGNPQGQPTTPTTSTRTTKKYNIPEGAVQIDKSKSTWESDARKAVQEGRSVYIKDGEGYKKVNGLTTPKAVYDANDSRYKTMGQYAGEYATMADMVKNNPEFQDALYDKYKNEQSAKSNKTGKLLTKDEMLDNFLNFQSQVYSIRNLPTEEQIDPKWDNADNKKYNEVANKLGFKALNPNEIATAQATYSGLIDLSKDSKFSNIFENYDVVPVGLGDENAKGRKDISPIDSDFGNTTQGQWFRPKATALDLADVAMDETTENITTQAPIPDSPQYTQPKANSDWWLQDIVKTAGAFGDGMRVNKYLPWDRPMDLEEPDVVFYDPSRALASNAEQANIAGQALSSFAGAQNTSARASQIQGAALTNSANILGDYENKNVGIANQYASNVSGIRNQESSANREIAKNLYDGTTIANQQYDNSKAMARQSLRQSYIDAITNRAQTQAMNTLYPQYNIDPMSGGFVDFTEGRKINTRQGSSAPSNPYQVDNKYLETVKALKGQGYDEATIRQAMERGTPPIVNPSDREREEYFKQYGIMYGQ